MEYDPQNPFARILRGELPCKKFYEDAHALAFEDIKPDAPIHLLVVPKGSYLSFDDFVARAQDAEIYGFFASVRKVAEKAGLSEDGYRLITNHQSRAGQTVFHFHVHLLGGKQLGPLLASD